MSLQNIHLRKLLKVMYLEGAERISALRSEIRQDIARERGLDGDGGDFYAPFWRDAKDHVFGLSDLGVCTAARIANNPRRRNLYTQLHDGFLLWWDRRRRWTNQPFVPAAALRNSVRFASIGATIKFASILAVRDGREQDHFIYPYWFPRPLLTDEMGRLGLWALCQAFPRANQSELRLLDIVRGQTFSLDRNPLQGNEAALFEHRFNAALAQWTNLRGEYD